MNQSIINQSINQSTKVFMLLKYSYRNNSHNATSMHRADISHFLFSLEIVVRFRGKAAHAGATPWEGLNALDAAVASYVNIGLLRQQMKTTARVHGVITEGGGSPNVIPEEAEMSYNIRAPSTAELVELTRRVEACFHAAAEATGCTAHIDAPAMYMHIVHNSAMARTYRKHSHALGVTFLDDVGNNLVLSGASTDCGNVSHRVPTIHPVFAIGSAQGPANHTRGFADVANAAESQPPTLRAAKALALTVLDLLMDAELMCEVQREFVALQLLSEEKKPVVIS